MKYCLCIFLLVLSAVPALAQDEANALRELGMYGAYAEGDLALADIQKGNDPLLQLKRFFVEAKLPLSSMEEKQLKTNIDTTVKALQAAKNNDDIRKANQDFNKAMFTILTPDQQAGLKRYRNQQIMMHGGFPALKLMLENAKTPLTPEQEKQAQTFYQQFNQQADQLTRSSNGNPDKAQLDKLESDALGNVVKLLTPAQRRALAASRLGTLNSPKPPR